MKIILTGGAGFIGSHIAEAYLKAKHEVVIIDDLSTGQERNIPSNAVFYRKSILDPSISSIFAKEKPDVVNHHAAQIDLRKSVEDPVYDAQINVLGSLNVLESARKAGAKKIIFASSAAVYGEQEIFPATEDHPLRPLTPYGVTKLTVENYLRFYRTTYGLHSTVFRYANVYGPRQNSLGEAGVISIFASKLAKGERPAIYGDGSQTRDFIYVKDVAAANLQALDETASGTFHVSTSIETSISDLCGMIAGIMGKEITPTFLEKKAGDLMKSALKPSRLVSNPTVLQDGLRETVNWFITQ